MEIFSVLILSPTELLNFTIRFGVAGILFPLKIGLENELWNRLRSVSKSSSQSPIRICFGFASGGISRYCSSMSFINRLGLEKFVFPFRKRDFAKLIKQSSSARVIAT